MMAKHAAITTSAGRIRRVTPLRGLMLLLPLLAAGCSSDYTYQREASLQAHSVFPQNYRTEIVQLMRTYLNDPTGVRDAYVSEPIQRPIDGANRYSSCVRYTAKKVGGQYGP